MVGSVLHLERAMRKVHRAHDSQPPTTANEQMRFRTAAWIGVFICCFAPSGWPQQMSDVAYVEMVRVKPGENEKFETTLKRHWDWHKKQGETWKYFVWTVDTGKNDGAYEIASFGHTWKEGSAQGFVETRILGCFL
jgi:hypothetical protein